jgi:hypothetical protein
MKTSCIDEVYPFTVPTVNYPNPTVRLQVNTNAPYGAQY